MNPSVAVIALSLAVPLIGGCSTAYTVDVENRTPQPVVIELLAREPDMGLLATLAQPLRLGPGDRGGIGPVRTDTTRPVLIRADSAVRPGDPVLLDLWPGWTIVEVSQDGSGTTGPLHLRPSVP
jgi:hypothetical protein